MIRFARDFRLIPLVLLATICLFALKVSGLVLDGGYTLGERLAQRGTKQLQASTTAVPDYTKVIIADQQPKSEQPATRSWAQAMFNYGNDPKADDDITGSTEGAPSDSAPQLKTSTKPPDAPKLDVGGSEYKLVAGQINSPGERAILERLRARNQTLDKRARELDMRENLIKAAEKRVEVRVHDLKDIEARINTVTGNHDKAELERFKSIVTMYENMKPKDAARIFDRLDLKILVQLTTQINPRKMSDILAQMAPESAERLTVELATRASDAKPAQTAAALPKIEGQPTGQ